MEEKTGKNKMQRTLTIMFALAIAIILATAIYSIMQLKKFETNKPETVKAPEIDLYKIVPAKCDGCFSIELVEQFVQQNSQAKIIETKTLKTDSDEAKEMIKKYKLARLPAIVITGEINRINLQQLETRDDALVFDKTPPPYMDVATGKINGKVLATIINDPGCKDCFDLNLVLGRLRQSGVYLTNKTIDYSSTEGKNLVQKYKIEKIPSLLLSKEAIEYELISNVWDKAGTKESDGTLVLRIINPPFKEVKTGKITGKPSIIYLADSSCKQCYNVTLHKNLLEANFGMAFEEERYADISTIEGKKAISKYKITRVPTVIISPEAEEYTSFTELWKQVGDVASDGSFVFRKLELLEGMTYKDLKNNKAVTAAKVK